MMAFKRLIRLSAALLLLGLASPASAQGQGQPRGPGGPPALFAPCFTALSGQFQGRSRRAEGPSLHGRTSTVSLCAPGNRAKRNDLRRKCGGKRPES